MNFNKHYSLEGRHATLSPSKYHWVNYSEDKLDAWFFNLMAAQRGTELHEYANKAIKLGMKQPTRPATTVGMYVNDALGFRMTPEQPLFYSDNCFGTADAISFRKMHLRIADLKTGVTPASMHQIEVYAALFCLEYGIKPFDITIEMRIYQNNECIIEVADPDVIFHIMDRIITFDRRINALKEEALS